VRVAASTAAAHSLTAGRTPHIVLADYRLRGQDDGVATVRALREQYARTAQVPGAVPGAVLAALLISGDTAPQRLRDAQAAGLVLLHKPVPMDVLVQAIHAALTSSGTSNRIPQANNEFDDRG
jgi:DNA-binding NarL/FixJ family response regulator